MFQDDQPQVAADILITHEDVAMGRWCDDACQGGHGNENRRGKTSWK